MNETKFELEREMDMPKDWVSNKVLIRDGRGRVVEVAVPDDEEDNRNADND